MEIHLYWTWAGYLLTCYHDLDGLHSKPLIDDDAVPSIMFRSRSLKSRTRGNPLKPELRDSLKVAPDEAKKKFQAISPHHGRPPLISMKPQATLQPASWRSLGGRWVRQTCAIGQGGGGLTGSFVFALSSRTFKPTARDPPSCPWPDLLGPAWRVARSKSSRCVNCVHRLGCRDGSLAVFQGLVSNNRIGKMLHRTANLRGGVGWVGCLMPGQESR